MDDSGNNNVRWHAVSTLRDDEVDFDENWLNEAIDQMLSGENKHHETEKVEVVSENTEAMPNEPHLENSSARSPSVSPVALADEQELVFETEAPAPVDIPSQSHKEHSFAGKVLENASFAGQTLDNESFRGASLINADFSGVNLKNVDFSGADLSGADFSNAKLDGVDLSGAILRGTKFPKAKLDNVKFSGADLDNADLSDVDLNELSLEDLQALIEYLAKYFPHKLNFALLNLRLLDLTRIDLAKCDLRGADFTGIDFTGVSLVGVNLSECIITPQQIAQALGRPPTIEEMKQLFAPRDKEKKGKGFSGIDWQDFFFNNKEVGVWDFSKDKGISVETLVNAGRKVFRRQADKPHAKENDSQEQTQGVEKTQAEIDKEKVLENIEKNRQAVLEARKERQKEQALEEHKKNREIDFSLVRGRGSNER